MNRCIGESVNFGHPPTSCLLVIGVVAAFAYSTISLFFGGEHVYFEVACMILVAVTLGRWFEAAGKIARQSGVCSRWQRLLNDTAVVLCDGNEEIRSIDEIACGDQLRVRPGERVDGSTERLSRLSGSSTIKSSPEKVCRVSCNEGTMSLVVRWYSIDPIIVRATATSHDGTLQRMIDAVERAAMNKGAEQRLADRLAACFVPLVTLFALATLSVHWWQGDFHSALMASLAVVLIACPCALAIATPLATWAAINVAARHQVLLRHGDALSQLARVDVICFDKTGTLTKGNVEVHPTFLLRGDALDGD